MRTCGLAEEEDEEEEEEEGVGKVLRELHSELHNFCTSPYIIMIMKPRRMR
jgi:hypothetical protein